MRAATESLAEEQSQRAAMAERLEQLVRDLQQAIAGSTTTARRDAETLPEAPTTASAHGRRLPAGDSGFTSSRQRRLGNGGKTAAASWFGRPKALRSTETFLVLRRRGGAGPPVNTALGSNERGTILALADSLQRWKGGVGGIPVHCRRDM